VELSVTVRNSGPCAGKEVVQVYAAAPAGTLEKPAKELKAFAKTRQLAPGEQQTLTMTVARRDLASFSEATSEWVADTGRYTFFFGASIADIRQQATVAVEGYRESVANVLQLKEHMKTLHK